MIFGVDSSRAVSSALLADVTRTITKPAFWGRYLTGYPFGPAELELLAENGIKLLPVYQETTQHPERLAGPESNGTADAAAAVAAAIHLGVPARAGIALYADIEGSYLASAAWLSGWIAGLRHGGFVPGIYCGSDKSGITGAYAGISHDERVALLIWSNSPCYDMKYHSSIGGMPATMGAAQMSAGGGLHVPDMWQYAIPVGDAAQEVDLDVCTQRAYAAMCSPSAA